MTRLRIILNGKSAGDIRVREAVTALRAEGHEIEVRPTWEAGDVQRLTAEAMAEAAQSGIEVIVAGGGDGTVNEVFSTALMRDEPFAGSFGILPLGTANDFARSAGIDPTDLTGALRRAAEAEPTRMDVGLFNGRAFINLLSGGFGARITAETDAKLKKQLGGIAYGLTGMAHLGDLTPSTGVFRGEGFEWRGAFVAMVIGNGRQAGGGIVLCPDATINDGLLDLMVLPEVPPEARSETFVQLLRQGRDALRSIEVRHRSAWFEYEADEPLHINLDGEPTLAKTFRVECRAAALAVRLGPSPLLG